MSNYEELSLVQFERETSTSNWLGRIQLLESVVSTQEEAKSLAESGALEGTTVIAEEQTGARGRMGRKWF